MVILSIGGLDLSKYCEKGDFSVGQSPVYSDGVNAIDGSKNKKLMGYKYSISAGFNDVPDDVKKAIQSACKGEKVSISFDDVTADFDAPVVSCKTAYETSGGVMMWSVNISSVCDIAPSSL